MDNIFIQDISMEYVPGLREVLDVICRERKYLAFLEAPALPLMQKFVKNIIDNGHIQKIALHNNLILGWCDILINEYEGFNHCGRLGMGVLPEYRGMKIGSKLLESVLKVAEEKQLKRIELEVFSDNLIAISLYIKYGFTIEGKKSKARYLDGRYEDIILMSLLAG